MAMLVSELKQGECQLSTCESQGVVTRNSDNPEFLYLSMRKDRNVPTASFESATQRLPFGGEAFKIPDCEIERAVDDRNLDRLDRLSMLADQKL